jgi:hypothetical protein
MALLESGVYSPNTDVTVYHWNAPDKDGDGAEVWQDSPDGSARDLAKDGEGNVIRSYEPPEGFKNFPSFDYKDCYVLVDERNRIKRAPNGEAYGIEPGCTLVVKGDGSSELLRDDRARYAFAKSHSRVSDSGVSDSGSESSDTVTLTPKSKTPAK